MPRCSLSRRGLLLGLAGAPAALQSAGSAAPETPADLVLTGGRIVTADDRFRVVTGMAVRAGRVASVGTDAEVLAHVGPCTRRVALDGAMLLPGLIDSHTHPIGAAMTEFDHEIPVMEGIADVLAYVRGRASVVPKGEWITLRQVFITRLKEQRYPTRQELDAAAPEHPVLFSTGPDAALNSLALRRSEISAGFRPPDGGAGKVETDPATGEPTGILRNLTRYVRVTGASRTPTRAEEEGRVLDLFRDYLRNGITTIADRNASASALDLYARLRRADRLPLRVFASHSLSAGSSDQVEEQLRRIALHPLRREDPRLRIIGVKTFLDGGMLTGSAYMRRPWGVSSIYSITDPEYRGLLFIPEDRLRHMVRATVRHGLQFTAHSVGDGAVHALLNAYEGVNAEYAVRPTRPCITHSNFMSEEAVKSAARLGVCVDIQPAWLYLDARTLTDHFGYDRLRWFQPLKSIFRAGGVAGGGSDHMQKIGGLRSVNPYNPFLAMWVAITRQARNYEGRLHPEEALSRQEAVRFYTGNNAYMLFREHEIGSLEPGKRADFIQIDRDLLTCPVDDIRDTRVLRTWVDGREEHHLQQAQ